MKDKACAVHPDEEAQRLVGLLQVLEAIYATLEKTTSTHLLVCGRLMVLSEVQKKGPAAVQALCYNKVVLKIQSSMLLPILK